jgi:hypothetical protein
MAKDERNDIMTYAKDDTEFLMFPLEGSEGL